MTDIVQPWSLMLASARAVYHMTFRAAITAYKCTGSVVKINLALNGLPNFTAFPNKSDKEVNLPHRTTMHVCPSIEFVDRAWEDALQGRPSTNPATPGSRATSPPR